MDMMAFLDDDVECRFWRDMVLNGRAYNNNVHNIFSVYSSSMAIVIISIRSQYKQTWFRTYIVRLKAVSEQACLLFLFIARGLLFPGIKLAS